MLKVMTVVGTRPELIRLSRVIARLDATVEHVLVHTGQNYDFELNEVFFRDLGIRRPDYALGVDTSSLGHVLGETLIRIEEVLLEERPDAFLVLGDTNSCIAALMAKRMQIPVYHMEAGNRCFDENVPEETNRRLVDHISDFNLVYTEHARRNLLSEGIHPRRILLTGSPMREVLDHHAEDIAQSTVLDKLSLEPGAYFLISAHRQENVDDPERLAMLMECLRVVRRTWGLPVLVSTHPRTRDRLGALGVDAAADPGLVFHPPFGFFDYVRLQQDARCVLSDSGTISEEAAVLGVAAVTLRGSIERPEALDAGTIVMTDVDAHDVVQAIPAVVERAATGVPCPPDYLIDDTSRRTVNFILSTAARHHGWAGIRQPSDNHADESLHAETTMSGHLRSTTGEQRRT